MCHTEFFQCELSEMEQRKEKFMALQNKRREEELRRKRKLDGEKTRQKEERRYVQVHCNVQVNIYPCNKEEHT